MHPPPAAKHAPQTAHTPPQLPDSLPASTPHTIPTTLAPQICFARYCLPGLEPQTRKLFEVCRINGLPIFTFCNKMDRPSLAPLELCDQIEKEFKLQTYAVNWPIGSGDRFKGVYHRPLKQVHLFQKVASGSKEAQLLVLSADDPGLAAAIGDQELYEQMVEARSSELQGSHSLALCMSAHALSTCRKANSETGDK